MTGADLSACEDRLYAQLATNRPGWLRAAGWLLKTDMRLVALLRRELL